VQSKASVESKDKNHDTVYMNGEASLGGVTNGVGVLIRSKSQF
jgi:hypothetical protein